MNNEQGIYWMVKNDPSRLLRLLDKDELRSLLDDFTGATGLTANIITTEGKSIFSRADAQKMCTFCQLVRKLQRRSGFNRCADSYKRVGKKAAEYGEASIFRCPAGLVECITPIMSEGAHIGSIICGQVLMWEPDDFFWVELERCNSEIADNMAPLIAAAKELQVVPVDKVQAASRLLGVVADKIVEALWGKIKHDRDIAYQSQLLEKEQLTRKKLEDELNANNATYFIDQSKTLMNAIENSNFKEARRLFTVILADTVSPDIPRDLAYLRLCDIVFSLSHVVVDRTRETDACARATIDYCKAAWLATGSEELGKVAQGAFDALLEILQENARPHNRSVEAMCGYVQSHLGGSFSLQDVAESVELSPYYASRIFKEDQGVTIMEYATKLRMDEAKLLLTNPRYRIDEIAAKVGYGDSSYFARVFKKHEGMSPRDYRASH